MDSPLDPTRTYLTLGGAETFLIFQKGIALREFCGFEVFESDDNFRILEEEFLRPTADAALEHGHGLITDCMVWRASPDWVQRLGYPADDVRRINLNAVERMRGFVDRWRKDRDASPEQTPILLMGELGPRGDGYKSDDVSAEEAQSYHDEQVAALARAGVDILGALTMTGAAESIGIVRAAGDHDLPALVSATVETNGHLPDGTSLQRFVERVDAATHGYPLGYMVNCAHPTHLQPALVPGPWLDRFLGFRANASSKSHEELDNSTELDAGNPADLGQQMQALRLSHGLRIVGGCCGTDATHIAAMAAAATA